MNNQSDLTKINFRNSKSQFYARNNSNSEYLNPYEISQIHESMEETERNYNSRNTNSVNVRGSVNGTRKSIVNFKLDDNKFELIHELSRSNYKTPTYQIIECLEEIFKGCESKESHWKYIASTYNPREINRVIYYMVKQYDNWSKLDNPASFFTSLIQRRKTKKSIQIKHR